MLHVWQQRNAIPQFGQCLPEMRDDEGPGLYTPRGLKFFIVFGRTTVSEEVLTESYGNALGNTWRKSAGLDGSVKR